MKTHPKPAISADSPRDVQKRAPVSTERPTPFTPNSERPDKIPRQWAWHYRTLLRLRERLLSSRADHSSQALASPEMLGVDVADTSREHADRDLLWAELGAEDDQLFEVDCALQRIRDGLYGLCEETGLPIAPERLRAIPWTRYCRTAAERHEPEPAHKPREANLPHARPPSSA
jgi:RNA polymerase-binding transcription factor DksA